MLAELAVAAESPESLLDTLFLRFLARFPSAEDRASLIPALRSGFVDRLLQVDPDIDNLVDEPLPQVTWTNHLVPEANEIQLEIQRRVLAGPPPDPRLRHRVARSLRGYRVEPDQSPRICVGTVGPSLRDGSTVPNVRSLRDASRSRASALETDHRPVRPSLRAGSLASLGEARLQYTFPSPFLTEQMNMVGSFSRRQALTTALAATGAQLLPTSVQASQSPLRGGAEHVISIWLGGGMGQIDTFDPKPKGDPQAKKAGGYYDPIETSVPGVMVCEHLPKLAERMERVTAVRSVHHEVIDEHAAATNRMHTGRPISGTVTYPSLGSLIAHERGAAGDGVPPYVVIGYPNVTRGPGFLGAQHGYLYLTDTSRGPMGLSRADGITTERQVAP